MGKEVIKLNLGCGKRPKEKGESWINIDYDSSVNPDLVWDITWGLPFENDSVSEFYISHVMEHLTREQMVYLMREIWRTGKKDATVNIITPHWNYHVAWDMMHIKPLSQNAFLMWQRDVEGVQSYKPVTLGIMFFKIEEVINDSECKINAEPQIYYTLKVDKI